MKAIGAFVKRVFTSRITWALAIVAPLVWWFVFRSRVVLGLKVSNLAMRRLMPGFYGKVSAAAITTQTGWTADEIYALQRALGLST